VDFLYFDRSTLDFGKRFRISRGSDVLFDGRISGLEANFPDGEPPQLTVLAEDRLQDLRMTRRTRTFADMSDSDLFNRIAGDHGLTPQVNVNGPSYKLLAQVNQSDLAFLRERARSIDAELWMDGTKLLVESRAHRSSGAQQMTYGSTLREFSVCADLAQQRTALQVCGWDVAGKSALNYEATDSVINGELGGGLSGASVLSSAFGERKEVIVHTVPHNSQETQAQAEAFFKMAARRFVVGRGTAQTDSRLRVGCSVDLQGLGPLFNGNYYLAEVRHIFDGVTGMRTEFTAERCGLGRV
jgi:phage protein D